MRKHTQIQSLLWKLANYNSFYMKFCNTLFNNVSGIGGIFFMQICISFISGYLISTIITSVLPLSLIIGVMSSLLLFFYVKFSTLFLSITFSSIRLLILLLLSILITILITFPFLLKIFHSQIEYVFLLNEGVLSITGNNKIWNLLYGLYRLWCYEENGLIVFFVSISLFSLLLFIFFYPYILIYQNKTSLYYKILRLYEERFNQE